MPIFEYTCSDCKKTFDILHKGAENKDLVECPDCHPRNAVKKFSSFSASVSSTSSAPSCESGSCGVPAPSPCAGGMCGLG